MRRREDTPIEAKVRDEVRPWMEEHAGRFGIARHHERLVDNQAHVEAAKQWQAELDSGGWGAVGWPEQFGGGGYGPNESRVVNEEVTRFAAPTGAFHIAIGMVGPTLMAHGTPEQQERFLAPMRQGDHVWCQLFSEPDAGSDLASLRT